MGKSLAFRFRENNDSLVSVGANAIFEFNDVGLLRRSSRPDHHRHPLKIVTLLIANDIWYPENRFFSCSTKGRPILALMIERARTASGLTYEEVAKKLNLKSRSNIKTMMNGKHDPGFSKPLKLMEVMGYDLEIGLQKRA